MPNSLPSHFYQFTAWSLPEKRRLIQAPRLPISFMFAGSLWNGSEKDKAPWTELHWASCTRSAPSRAHAADSKANANRQALAHCLVRLARMSCKGHLNSASDLRMWHFGEYQKSYLSVHVYINIYNYIYILIYHVSIYMYLSIQSPF